MTVERVPLARPLTARQERVVALLSEGLTYYAISRHAGGSEHAVRRVVKRVARHIPGDLPCVMRCVVWWRGATIGVLMGVPTRHPDKRDEMAPP